MSTRKNTNKALLDNLFGGKTESLLNSQMSAGGVLESETLNIPPEDDSEAGSRQEPKPERRTGPVRKENGNPERERKHATTLKPRRTPEKDEEETALQEIHDEDPSQKHSSKVDYAFYARIEPVSVLKLKAICRKEGTSMSKLIGEVIEMCVTNYEKANGEVNIKGVSVRKRTRRKKVFEE